MKSESGKPAIVHSDVRLKFSVTYTARFASYFIENHTWHRQFVSADDMSTGVSAKGNREKCLLQLRGPGKLPSGVETSTQMRDRVVLPGQVAVTESQITHFTRRQGNAPTSRFRHR